MGAGAPRGQQRAQELQERVHVLDRLAAQAFQAHQPKLALGRDPHVLQIDLAVDQPGPLAVFLHPMQRRQRPRQLLQKRQRDVDRDVLLNGL